MAEQALRIPLKDVRSSSIAALGYDPEKKILAIKFTSGAVYHHAGVSAEQVAALEQADSIGKFFSTAVRGKHPAEKMTGTCSNCGAKHGYIGETCTDCGTATYAPDARKER